MPSSTPPARPLPAVACAGYSGRLNLNNSSRLIAPVTVSNSPTSLITRIPYRRRILDEHRIHFP